MHAIRATLPAALRMLPVAVAASACIGSAQAQTNQELKVMLDQALQTIQQLQNRVQVLEQGKAAAPSAPAPTAAAVPPPPPPPAPVVAPGSAADAGATDAGGARVEVYGQVMLDAIYDFKRMNPSYQATLRPSQIPVFCPGDPGCGKDGAFVFSIRQSSLGVRAAIPTSVGELKTDLAFDLFGSDGGTNIHWLRAWAELGAWGVGQYDSNFMDIDVFPNTIDYWGPSGMVFVRNPQVRFKPIGDGAMTWAVSLEAPNSVLDTGKITEIDPAFGAGIVSHNRLPDVVGSFRLDGDWGHVRAAGILRQVGFQNSAAADGSPSGQKGGYGLNLSGTLKLFGNDKLSWQLVGGTAIASYMNDGGTDLAPDDDLSAEAVKSLGWFAYYNHAWSDRWSTAFGYSEHRQDNTAGQLASAFKKGSYASVNLLHAMTKNVTTGLEYVWGRRETLDSSSAVDYRLQFSTRVSF